MKFRIRRTSSRWGDESIRVSGAVKAEDGGWFIEISDLDGLMNLVSELDCQVIISAWGEEPDVWSLEVYDDYRE